MKTVIRIILIYILLVVPQIAIATDNGTTKKERNLISQGNELHSEKNYAGAVASYRDALKINPLSQVAEFNLASALINLSEKDYDKNGSKPIDEAVSLFKQLANSNNKNIVQKSLYNLGHICYNNKDYTSSIEYYKKVLRLNPNDDKARIYLRMAQLKQKQNNQSEDKENQEENKKEKQEEKQEEKDNNQPQNNQPQKQEEQQSQNQENINDANAERILKSIENKEQETLMRIQKRNKDAQRTNRDASGRYIEKPW